MKKLIIALLFVALGVSSMSSLYGCNCGGGHKHSPELCDICGK